MTAPHPVELTDGVIVLSALTDDDVDALVAGEDEELALRLAGGRATVETTRRHVAEVWPADWYRPDARLAWGIRDAASGTLAGTADVQLARPDLERGAANLVYGVFPPWRGHRYAARAVELMCGFLTRSTTTTVAVLRIEPDNAPSLRVAHRCGFREVTQPAGSVFPPSFARFDRELV